MISFYGLETRSIYRTGDKITHSLGQIQTMGLLIDHTKTWWQSKWHWVLTQMLSPTQHCWKLLPGSPEFCSRPYPSLAPTSNSCTYQEPLGQRKQLHRPSLQAVSLAFLIYKCLSGYSWIYIFLIKKKKQFLNILPSSFTYLLFLYLLLLTILFPINWKNQLFAHL